MQAQVEKAATSEKAVDLRGTQTVLVVDDEPRVRRAAGAMLERYGYTVLLAQDGERAVDVFRKVGDQVSLVLLDLTMPVMSGEETLRQLKSIRPDVRVVLSSGYNEIEAVRNFSGQGLNGFLQEALHGNRTRRNNEGRSGGIETLAEEEAARGKHASTRSQV
jgi:CheY-like chemotaxis protein